MMYEFVLITFYNRGTTINPIWEVFGHISETNNKHLNNFKTKLSAILYAHEVSLLYGKVPVLQTDKGGDIAKILTPK